MEDAVKYIMEAFIDLLFSLFEVIGKFIISGLSKIPVVLPKLFQALSCFVVDNGDFSAILIIVLLLIILCLSLYILFLENYVTQEEKEIITEPRSHTRLNKLHLTITLVVLFFIFIMILNIIPL